MRFPRKRKTARTIASTLALALVAVLMSALPASASTVTSFSPMSGPPGTLVTITGTGFTGMTGVDFDAGAGPDAAVTWTFLSDTSATAVVPCSTEDGPIRVNTPSPDTASIDIFDATAPGPATVSSFAPTSGPVGTSVVITGTNLCGATQVLFNATTAPSFTVDSDSQITATVPTGATTGPVHVTVGAVTSDSASSFTVSPTITSFAPTSGPVGTSVVITGTTLTGATSVMFNATAATAFTVDSATQITATVPGAATTGPIAVTTPGGTANSAAGFTVTAPGGGGGGGGGGATGTATITSFTPASGPVGTSVVITGTNLTGATSVTFNNVPATTFTVDSASQITATVPTGATTGKIAVTIPGAGGTATSATDFTVTTAPATKHGRSVNLHLRKHLIATGTIHVADGFDACRSYMKVKIQRLKHHVWKTISVVETNANGRYRERLTDRAGRYRVIAKKVVLNDGADICAIDRSAPVRHHH